MEDNNHKNKIINESIKEDDNDRRNKKCRVNLLKISGKFFWKFF